MFIKLPIMINPDNSTILLYEVLTLTAVKQSLIKINYTVRKLKFRLTVEYYIMAYADLIWSELSLKPIEFL